MLALSVSFIVNFGEPIALKVPRCAVIPLINGTIAFWDDPAIAAANPLLALPHQPVKVVVRSDASGTTEVTLTGLAALERECTNSTVAASTAAVYFTVGTSWPFASPGLQKGNGNPGVAALVASTMYSVGYVSTPIAIAGGFSALSLLDTTSGQQTSPDVAVIAATAARLSVMDPVTLKVTLLPS